MRERREYRRPFSDCLIMHKVAPTRSGQSRDTYQRLLLIRLVDYERTRMFQFRSAGGRVRRADRPDVSDVRRDRVINPAWEEKVLIGYKSV